MSEKVRPIDLANRWGVKKQYINTLLTQGMPIDSIEAAEAWYYSRRMGSANNTNSMTDFQSQIENQRRVVMLAYNEYMDNLRNASPDANKSYATYDKAVNRLSLMEKENDARRIASGEYIKLQTAIERFGKVTAQMREELTQVGSKIASKANPDNPGRAMKAIDDEMKKVLERFSQSANYAEQAVVKEPDQDEINEINETTEDTIDEVESE